MDPHVSGNWVSYTNNGTGSSEIDYYNLATAQTENIDNNGGNDTLSGISGTTIAYTHEDSSGNFSIDAYDIAGGNPPAALVTGDVALNPAIGGDTVAWVDYTNDPQTPQIMVYNTATQAVTDLTAPGTVNIEPAVSPDGSVVVWVECDASGTPCNVWEAILGSGGTWTSSALTSGSDDSEQPHTNGNIVVYSSLRSGVQGIYWQPVGGGTEQEVPFPESPPGTSSNPHASGDLISFENLSSAGQSNIYVYSLATQTLYQVTNTPGVNAVLDDISVTPGGAGSVVWEALVSGQYNIYGLTFQAPPLTVTTTSLPDAGYGQPYSQTLASSGTGPDTWAVTGGSLPAGLTLNPATGTISGTPTAASPATFTVSATDTGNPPQTATQQFTLAVDTAPLTITASGGSMTYGGAPPTITPAYTGFVNGDGTGSLTTAPTCATTATSASPVGSYPSSCTGAADPNYTISYVGGTITVAQASTTLAYAGPQSISAGASLAPAAILSSSASACQASQPVTFILATNPTTGASGSYSLESATTNPSGAATGAPVSTTGWQAGAYTITASYAGTANCSASTATAPLVVTTAGLAAAGAGSYTNAGVGPVGFGFIVAHIPHTSSYLGAITLINTGSWRLTGTLSSYTKSATQGTATGTGSLSWWNPSLNNNHGGWQLAKTGVAFTASFTATTKTSPGSFGIQITYTPASPQPPALPNSSPVSLASGAILMA